MSNQIFDRNKPKDSYEPIRRLRNKKLSMDDIFKHINHPSIEMRKTYKKTNN